MTMQRLLVCTMAAGLALAGCSARVGYGYVTTAPPLPRVEARGVAPGAGFVWIDGFWHWSGNGYAWSPGRWERPPRHGARWVPGRWEHSHGGYHWREGRWR